MQGAESEPVRWLAVANVLWLAGGVLAYFTSASLVVGTAIALVPALPGLLELRRTRPDGRLDGALAAVVGTWAVMAIFVLIPYTASEGGLSLWTSRGFHGVGVAAAALGFLLWNVAAARALGVPRAALRPWIALHLLGLLAALYVLPGDGGAQEIALRGDVYPAVDLHVSPMLAALPGMLWGAVLLRLPLGLRDAPAPPGPAAPRVAADEEA